MPKDLPKLAPIARIVKMAARQQSGAMAEFGCRSYPIPAPGPEGLSILFLFARTRSDGGESPVWIAPPEYVVAIDAETGRDVGIRPLDTAGLAGTWLGQDHSAARRQEPGFLEQEAAMLAEYDLVLPPMAAGVHPLPAGAGDAMAAISSRFRFVHEPPLAPYYARLGAWFFARLAEARP
ncbi:MAG: hypothetical protein R2729_19345 [Bryobacteraceae bacterium]